MGCPPSASIWLRPLTRAAAVEVGADPSCSPSQMPEGLACGEGPDLADGQPSPLLVAALGDSPLSLALSCCCQRLAGKLCQRCLRGKQAAAGAAGLSRSRFKCASPAAAPVGAVGPGVCVRVHFLHFLIEDLKSLSGPGWAGSHRHRRQRRAGSLLHLSLLSRVVSQASCLRAFPHRRCPVATASRCWIQSVPFS